MTRIENTGAPREANPRTEIPPIREVTPAEAKRSADPFEISEVKPGDKSAGNDSFKISEVKPGSKSASVEAYNPRREITPEKDVLFLDEKASSTDAPKKSDAEMAKMSVSDRAPEKKAEAMRELNLHTFSAEELQQVERSSRTEVFTDGEGVIITKAKAVNRMTDSLSEALDRLPKDRGMTEERKAAILREMRTTIYAQEAENQGRGIGNHGIPHLYGVYERMNNTPDEVLEQAAENLRRSGRGSEATAADIRAGLVLAAAYHDEGYLAEVSRDKKAMAADGGARAELAALGDKLHGVDSAIVFEQVHSEALRGVVDDAVLEDVRVAIAEHNGPINPVRESPAREDTIARMRESRSGAETIGDMDPNKNFVRSALLLSDRLALDTSEKMPDVLRDKDRAQLMIEYYQMKAEPDEDFDRLTEKMRETLSAMVDADSALSDAQKARYRAAIERDINPGAGKFDLPMAAISTSADSLQFKRGKDGRIEAEVTLTQRSSDTVYTAAFGKNTPEAPSDAGRPPVTGRQLNKALDDYGVDAEKLAQLNGGEPTDWYRKTDEDTVTLRTDARSADGTYLGISGLDNVTIRIADMTPERLEKTPEYMEQAMRDSLQRLEALREEEAVGRIAEQAAETFRSSYKGGAVDAQGILDVCTQIYSAENRSQIDAIVNELNDSDGLSDKRLRELADKCLALLPGKDDAGKGGGEH